MTASYENAVWVRPRRSRWGVVACAGSGLAAAPGGVAIFRFLPFELAVPVAFVYEGLLLICLVLFAGGFDA